MVLPEAGELQPLRLLFVYGTLRAGASQDIHRLAPPARFIGRGRVQGRLYNLGRYPGLVRGGEGWVQGEVYAITRAQETLLDTIEEIWPQRRGEYLKVEALVIPEGPHAIPPYWRCLLYELHAAHCVGRPQLAHGDWLRAMPEA